MNAAEILRCKNDLSNAGTDACGGGMRLEYDVFFADALDRLRE